ncbi:MAG: hypothetical protein HRU31_07740 [Rhodobacteraceae bacterium]|nr:hypothetical protein [Paracoccaceae bacterium]
MDRYSKIVAILKVVLPLSALGILSVLFFLSRSVDYTARIPFADDEIAEMTRTQRITLPEHTAVTQDGDQIRIRAGQASPETENAPAQAQEVIAEILFADGSRTDLIARRAQTTDRPNVVRLVDQVNITSSLGYVVSTDLINTATNRIDLWTPSPVSGYAPMGQIDAGGMLVRSENNSGDIHMLFTRGVKLVYLPKQIERP